MKPPITPPDRSALQSPTPLPADPGSGEPVRQARSTTAPPTPPSSRLRSPLAQFCAVALAAGLVLAVSERGSPGFAFGLGAGMAFAAAACLVALALGPFPVIPADATARRDDRAAGGGAADASSTAEAMDSEARPGDGEEPALQAAYAMLGLTPAASPREITEAYHRLAHRYHPDMTVGQPEEVRRRAEEQMKELNAAYQRLRGRQPRA